MRTDGAAWDVLWSEEGFETGAKRASGSGVPVLFPFPGRLPGTTFSWRGTNYALQEGDGRGNAIHGFVHDRPWEVTLRETQRVQGRFHAAEHLPNYRQAWPADFEIQLTYHLQGNSLHAQMRMTNTDSEHELPCGLGLHPYFHVPLSEAGVVNANAAGECQVQVPATRRWPLRDMLPVGHSEPWSQADAMRRGQRFADLQLDDVLGGLVFDDTGACQCAITDPGARRQVAVRFDRAFANCVVYNPPHREAICIEPYSCVPGAWLLENANEAGARLLPPGDSWEANVWIEASAVGQ